MAETIRVQYRYDNADAFTDLSADDRATVEEELLNAIAQYFNAESATGWDSAGGFTWTGQRLRELDYGSIFDFLDDALDAVNTFNRGHGVDETFSLVRPVPPPPLCEYDPKSTEVAKPHKDTVAADLEITASGATSAWTETSTVNGVTITARMSIAVSYESVAIEPQGGASSSA
jgi:hypothetical protein